MSKSSAIQIITHSDHLEQLLRPFKDLIGDDYAGYRGHLYRVLTYTLHFLGVETPWREVVETALVYHDIGLWTDRELAYLEPSIARLEGQHGGEHGQLMRDIIFYHHKMTPFKGPHAEVVNAVRKADWIDATNGFLSKGVSRAAIRKVKAAIPAAGFYQTLMRLGPELSPNPLRMVARFMRVYKV